jgi:hypothetical protein
MEKRPTGLPETPLIVTLLGLIFAPIRFLFKALIVGISFLILGNTLKK